jgi:hypothetical protein
MGYLGAGRLGVKRVGDGRIGQKSGRWEKRNVREQKMVNYVREQGDWAK